MHQAPRLFEHSLIPPNPKPTRARKKEANKFSLFLGRNLTFAVFQLPSVNVGYQMEGGNDIVFLSIVSRKQYQISKGETATEYDERIRGHSVPTASGACCYWKKDFCF
ncbi:hypothetical protein CDAR_579441 [Caerostris darwini]|uniref:Uncharacterized protein n=1 Tax=Caerostris darwini TaxID=1538125 RepID=A0AAV4V2F2_9ARAC|nr:hypothetical protein CDAR_579441 [Caerostris darwini]